MIYRIYITPNGTNKRKVYGEYATMEEAENAQRNKNHIIRRSCTIQLWEEEK